MKWVFTPEFIDEIVEGMERESREHYLLYTVSLGSNPIEREALLTSESCDLFEKFFESVELLKADFIRRKEAVSAPIAVGMG